MPRVSLYVALSAVSVGAFTAPPIARFQNVHTVLHGFSEDYGWGQDVERKKERDARQAANGDRVVEIRKPLGLVLEEDNKGDVFIAEIVPGSNAASSGLKVIL
jgi:S1-C subfamily serine protease